MNTYLIWGLVIVAAIPLYLGFSSSASAQGAGTGIAPPSPMQCDSKCTEQCKASHKWLFGGRKKCEKECMSDCQAGLDISGY